MIQVLASLAFSVHYCLWEKQEVSNTTQRDLIRKKVAREELNSLVDRAADLIRTAVDYKFILVLLFLKRLNDLWRTEKLQAKERLIKEAGLSE